MAEAPELAARAPAGAVHADCVNRLVVGSGHGPVRASRAMNMAHILPAVCAAAVGSA